MIASPVLLTRPHTKVFNIHEKNEYQDLPSCLYCGPETAYLHVVLDELSCPDTSLHVKADVDFDFSLLVCELYDWHL